MKGNALKKVFRFVIFEFLKTYFKIKVISIGDELKMIITLFLSCVLCLQGDKTSTLCSFFVNYLEVSPVDTFFLKIRRKQV